MKNVIKKVKGKKVLSMLLALIMVLSVASPAFSEMFGITAKAAEEPKTQHEVELAFNNLFIFEKWANNILSSTVISDGTPLPRPTKDNETYALETDIKNGIFTLTKTNMAAVELYTAFSMDEKDAEKNTGYYTVDVKPNTKYELSYNMYEGNSQAFMPFVFYFNAKNLSIGHKNGIATENGVHNFEFTTPADTTHIQFRFTIGDNNSADNGQGTGNSSAASVTVKVKDIKLSEVVPPPESDNLFRFDDWAESSSGKIGGGTGTLEKDLVNNTMNLNNTGVGELFTAFTNSENPADNAGMYTIKVQPETEYSLSYTTFNNNTKCLYALVFFFDAENKCIGHITTSSENSIDPGESTVDKTNLFRHDFATPKDTDHIQIRFNIMGEGSVSLKNIVVCESYLISGNNLFDYNEWVNKSGSKDGGNGPGISVVHSPAVLEKNEEEQSLKFTANTTSAALTYFDVTSFDENNSFVVPSKPGKTYTFRYNFDATQFSNLDNVNQVRVFFAWYNSSKSFTGKYACLILPDLGVTSMTFTTPTDVDVAYFQVAFGAYPVKENASYVVRDIGIYETDISSYDLFEETGEKPVDIHRQVYTFNGDTPNYSELPTPSKIPEGQVFAGWYTGEDGSGRLITADTPIHYESLTVYSKFEPAVSGLSVATPPTKTDYTVGEKLDPTGLVLQATVNDTSGEGVTSTFYVTSGYRCSPEILTKTGTQTITVNYGGKTATFDVNVSAGIPKDVIVNGATQSVNVANNEYIINYSISDLDEAFNRYEITYFSDCYVKGEITMDEITEEFFLEPSDNGSFASYIDGFLGRDTKHYGVASIKFTCLNKEYGNFELKSLTTIPAPIPAEPIQYYQNDEYKVGISLDFGGVVSYIEDLDDDVSAAVYNENGKDITRVDYTSKLPSGATATSDSVNLINSHDRGRYLQQSYYGTDQPPFELGNYNGDEWPYNPVQGGNIKITDKNTGQIVKGNESSKVIDYRITKDQIYVKTRPLDWGKNSEDYPESYATDSYMESWYVFEDGMIKTYCRFVDFSGYPSNYRDQELPALYTIEPLNHLVYYGSEKSEDKVQKDDIGLKKEADLEFWGVSAEYNEYHSKCGVAHKHTYPLDNDRYCHENWAAFTASEDPESFGIGVYSAGVTDFAVGSFPSIYYDNSHNEQDRHAKTLNPAEEDPTSYISPTNKMLFESYKPVEYSYYITTGTAEKIKKDFNDIADADAQAEKDKTKIAVPETVYMTPANGASKVGQHYVNNTIDKDDYYKIKTEAKSAAGMYFGLRIKDAESFKVNVTNTTALGGEIVWTGSEDNTEGKEIKVTGGLYIDESVGSLEFSDEGLKPGEKTTAKWDITVTMADGSTKTHTAYTVMYAPGRTVGAVAEARQIGSSENEISSWITGANGVDHSQRAPLKGFHGDKSASGYFIEDPLIFTKPLDTINSTGETETDLINVAANDNEKYVLQTATNGHDGSMAQSYLGLLMVDGSRYTNTNQIPNLKIGFDALRVGEWKKDSLDTYKAYYTLGTAESFTSTDINATPSGWTEFINEKEYAGSHDIPDRKTIVPEYNVSDIDGKYIHAFNQGRALQTGIAARYSNAGTSVLCSVTDKSGLRDAVLKGYTQTNTTPEFEEALENAATVLGDPSATATDISDAQKELNNSMEEIVETFYALKYDNLFSAYEFSQHTNSMTMCCGNSSVSYMNGVITTTNTELDKYKNEKGEEEQYTEAYTSYGSGSGNYLVALKPNTEYVFEFDVTTDVKAQAFMFFYASDGSGVAPTSMQVKINNGAWQTGGPGSAHWGVYPTEENAHYAVKFTTGANTVKGGFRFGNTTNGPCTSTFSNIRLVDAAHYYEDVEYTKTEDVYKEYASYGTLPTLSRTGYSFKGWSDAEEIIGITGATIATEHRTIYSQWNVNTYNIVFDANGGTNSGKDRVNDVTYIGEINLPDRDALTKDGYILAGWSKSSAATSADYGPGEAVSKLTDVDKDTVTLYAVWATKDVKVLFDNLFDFSAWDIKPQNGTVDKTDTGFTITSTSGTDANTDWSDVIAVESGKTYIFSADASFTQSSGGYDMYVYTLDKNKNGETSATPDTANGAHREGEVYISLTGQTTNTKPYIKFTAGTDTAYVKIRFDANAEGNALTVNNIRFYEEGTVADGVSYHPTVSVGYGNTYGTKLPTPTRTGYTFTGWKNAAGQDVTSGSAMQSLETVNLYSQWTEIIYTVNYSKNGLDDATGTAESNKTYKYTDKLTLPAGYTHADAEFLGWSTNQYATAAEYDAGTDVAISDVIDKATAGNVITFHAVWRLKDSVLKEDTIVVDFGLPIVFAPFNNDTSVINYHTQDINMINSYNVSFEGAEYGELEYNFETRQVTYTPTKILTGIDEIALKVTLNYKQGGTNTITSTITVTPASNVYYEENILDVKVAVNTTPKVDWSEVGTATNTSRPVTEDGDVIGFDNAYHVVYDSNVENAAYSNGKALTVTVNNTDGNKNSEILTFDFVGTGFDIVSRCSNNTGMMLVSIKKKVDDKMKFVSTSIVDTYCAEGTFNQTPVFSWSIYEDDVDGVDTKGTTYGTYTVEISALYLPTAGALNATNTTNITTKGINKSNLIDTGLEMQVSKSFDVNILQDMLDEAGVEDVSAEDVELIWFDDNSIFNGGTGVATTKKGTRNTTTTTNLVNYIDGLRVYNPLGTGESVYTEKNVSYANVIENLAPVNTSGDSVINDLLGIAFITGTLPSNEDGTAGKLTFANYESVGPTGELYLNGNKGISFKINRGAGERVMLGLRAVNGTEETNILINDGTGDPMSVNIKSATEMYYDITGCIDGTGEVVITITNKHNSNLLAINHIKFSGGNGSNGTVVNPRSMARSADANEAITNKFLPITQEDLVVIEASMSGEPIPAVVKNGVVVPIVEEEEEIPEDNTNTDNDNTNDDTNTDGGDADDIFDIFSLLKALLAFIKKILFNTVGNESLL